MSLYSVAKRIVKAILFPIFRIQVHGTENIPKQGPVIICSNHISNLDPPIVGITSPRGIHFMAKAELFDKRLFGRLLRGIQAFPVKRGMKDKHALRTGIDILNNNHVLGLFPEGTRSKTGKLGDPLAGAGFFALRSNATIIPCAIIGPYKPGKKLHVVYGKPVDMETYRQNKTPAKEAVSAIMQDIQALINQYKAKK